MISLKNESVKGKILETDEKLERTDLKSSQLQEVNLKEKNLRILKGDNVGNRRLETPPKIESSKGSQREPMEESSKKNL